MSVNKDYNEVIFMRAKENTNAKFIKILMNVEIKIILLIKNFTR